MVTTSEIANAGFVWLALGLVGLFTDRRPAAWRLLLTVPLVYFVVDSALKPLFDRPRPFEVVSGLQVLADRPTNASFPSGHAARAVACAIAGSRMLPPLRWVLWPFAVLVAISRVYLGVHWPSDVIGGALVGAACGWLVVGGRTSAAR